MPIFKQAEFPGRIFIVASLSTLVSLPILIIFFKMLTTPVPSSDTVIYDYDTDSRGRDPLVTWVGDPHGSIAAPIISENDPFLGPEKAPVTIVQYSDFSCEFCQRQEAVLRQILDDYRDKVRLIWKDFPEDNSYSSSWQANIAARCAGDQGKFWPYHDLLFKERKDLSRDQAIGYAGGLGLDTDKFGLCLDDTAAKKKIKNNIIEAAALEIPGIPFIYVNEQEVMGEASYDDLKSIIEAELAQK